jgi:hypothetical protein
VTGASAGRGSGGVRKGKEGTPPWQAEGFASRESHAAFLAHVAPLVAADPSGFSDADFVAEQRRWQREHAAKQRRRDPGEEG